jgi:hypothetical protein
MTIVALMGDAVQKKYTHDIPKVIAKEDDRWWKRRITVAVPAFVPRAVKRTIEWLIYNNIANTLP